MLLARIAVDLSADIPTEIRAAAKLLAEIPHTRAVLFYGSVLRTGKLDDVLDFYVLTADTDGSMTRRAVSAVLWPDVSWRELTVGRRTIHAKVATMPLATFERAASGALLDTTIWARFAQPCALAWSGNTADGDRVTAAVAAAVTTAARFAAMLGPARGSALAYWEGLFTNTYRTEFRVEQAARSRQIVDHDPARYEALLPLAWTAAGIGFDERDGILAPHLTTRDRRRMTQAWRARVAAGKPLNIARLVKAAFTFEGATRYALWKIARHTGVAIPSTPWRERHPVLAAPGVLWRVFRARPR